MTSFSRIDLMAIEIRGGGLAGVALAWRLWENEQPFRLVGKKRLGASWASAGLMNPVAGRSMNPGPELMAALERAKGFYREIEERVGVTFLHECPVLRIFQSEKEREKFIAKRPELVAEGVLREAAELGEIPDCAWGAAEVGKGGWLDVRSYLEASWAFFEGTGEAESVDSSVDQVVHCEGFRDLSSGLLTHLPQRPAKGEILTVSVPGWGENRILNRSGWVVPLGQDRYRVGATYSWHELDEVPTEEGRERVVEILKSFTKRDFQILDHVAAVRPIVRRSEPEWGGLPGREGEYFLNGLGSKGCIFAPDAAMELVRLLEGNARIH